MQPATPQWHLPPDKYNLPADEVHVWCASLNQPSIQVDYLQRFLVADELQRAEQFYFEEHRRHFIVARGFLRSILGHYLDIRPDELRFDYLRFGKPILHSTHGKDLVHFNVSHSGGLVLYAVARHRKLGVDIEVLRTNVEFEQLSKRFFSLEEDCRFRLLSSEKKCQSFFEIWTRKEAYIKARGEGLAYPLDQFEVSFGDGKSPRLLNNLQEPKDIEHWSMANLAPHPDYIGALVVEGHQWRLRHWRLLQAV